MDEQCDMRLYLGTNTLLQGRSACCNGKLISVEEPISVIYVAASAPWEDCTAYSIA